MAPRRKDLNPKAGKDTPGPGAYINAGQNPSYGSPSVKIGTAKRNNYGKDDKPGPGNYDVSSSRPATAKSFPKAARNTQGRKKDNPGPGAYMHQDVKEGPQFSMSVKHYKSYETDTPGPGTYGYAEPAHTRSNVAIGTAKRGKMQKQDVPGPGNYNSYTTLSGPKFGFGTQSKLKKSSDEGPPMYNIPASIPNVPKYGLSGDILNRYSTDN